jgi:penicillin-insensitive murein endopeptidase
MLRAPTTLRAWLLAALVVCLGLSVEADGHARSRAGSLPDKYEKSPYNKMSLSVGAPNKGWQLRAARLKKKPYLVIKKNSKGNSYGHPALVKMIYRTARDISRSARRSVLLVGDLSSKKGGALAGHRSHQSGRDADVAFFAKNSKGKPVKLDTFVSFGQSGKAKDGSDLEFDDWRNWMLVMGWLRDKRAGISHIFVSSGLRRRLLDFARNDKRYRKYHDVAAKLLKQPEDSSPHDDHFHVRISCPKRQDDICREESL